MMFKNLLSQDRRMPAALIVLLMLAAALSGGSNRGDIAQLVLVRLTAVLCLIAAIGWMPTNRFAPVKWPLLLLAALAGWMLIQLIPLPPALWTIFPGRERLAATALALGDTQPWLPISIVPMRTLGSMLSLLAPTAALMMVGWLPRRSWPTQAVVLASVGVASALLAVIQILGPEDSIWYLYDVRQKGGAVGFFANRNHQAVLLATMLPMLAAIALSAARQRERGNRLVIALTCAAIISFLMPLIFITGSRAGLALTMVSLVATIVLLMPHLRRLRMPRSWRIGAITVVLTFGAGLIAILLSGRSLSMQRLMTTEVTGERRARVIEPIVQLVRENLPIGTGFGTFDPAFRAIEPYSELYRTYLNHAHSDPLEFVSDGGLPAGLILLAFAAWWAWSTATIWWRRENAIMARAASIATMLFMLGSLVDYPLRTPLAMVYFAVLIGWMAMTVHDDPSERNAEATGGHRSQPQRV